MKWWQWILIVLFSILVVSALLRLFKKRIASKNTSVLKNGFQVIKCFKDYEIEYLKENWGDKDAIKSFIHGNQNVLKHMNEILGPSYVFQDYVFLIEKSRIHTCHRDVNAKQFNEKQKYPSYTVIFYIEQMDRCLDVVDKSHVSQDGIFLTDETESIACAPGDAILFDAGLIHAGAKNEKPDNKRIQMKLTHVDDIETLSYFQEYNKTLTEDNKNPEIVNDVQKHLSCQFPVVSDMFKSTASKPVEEFFTSLFYGNSNFYDLKNI
jgi:ectoine hydroxylase-related dioxygenase (phytanoyl-CoA dioxygenase family)